MVKRCLQILALLAAHCGLALGLATTDSAPLKTLPDGLPDDAPGMETVHGLANRKNEALLEVLARHGAHAYQGARLYLELVRDASMRCAVVSVP